WAEGRESACRSESADRPIPQHGPAIRLRQGGRRLVRAVAGIFDRRIALSIMGGALRGLTLRRQSARTASHEDRAVLIGPSALDERPSPRVRGGAPRGHSGPHRLAVRTLPSHGSSAGSSPAGVTITDSAGLLCW